MAPTQQDRPLSDDEAAALRWILGQEDFAGIEQLRAQVPAVRVVFGRTTELSLIVDGAEPMRPPYRIPELKAVVVNEAEQATGFISVWISEGFLSEMDYSWVTDEMPTIYPAPTQLRRWDAG